MSEGIERGSYGQFCPVSMAAEIVCSRWTALVLRELLMGTTRFNDLRRGVPRMSPTLLSKRLKELEEAGVIVAAPTGQPGVVDYKLTEAGEDLRPVILSLGLWGQRWVESSLSLKNLDPSLLMWDMRRNLRIEPVPTSRRVVQVKFPDVETKDRQWWLVAMPDGCVDLCKIDPGFDVDLYVNADLRTLTAIWMGLLPFSQALREERVLLVGDQGIARAFPSWLALSPFAGVERAVA